MSRDNKKRQDSDGTREVHEEASGGGGYGHYLKEVMVSHVYTYV